MTQEKRCSTKRSAPSNPWAMDEEASVKCGYSEFQMCSGMDIFESNPAVSVLFCFGFISPVGTRAEDVFVR